MRTLLHEVITWHFASALTGGRTTAQCNEEPEGRKE